MKNLRHREKRKRGRIDRPTVWQRAYPARVFRVYPSDSASLVVEVHISRTQRHMRGEIIRFSPSGEKDGFVDTAGLVRTYYDMITGRQVVRPGGVIARMFLNAQDLRARPSEIVSHECTHAGMAWARHKKANIGVMPGEEVLCYAVGLLVKQVNRVCYAHGVWP